MADNQILTGLQQLAQGLNQYGLQKSVAEANNAVQMIRDNVPGQQDQRKLLDGVANNLVVRLSGLGAPASTIEALAKGIKPAEQQLYQTPEQFLIAQIQQSDIPEEEKTAKVTELLKKKQATENPLAREKFEAGLDKNADDALGVLAKELDVTKTSRSETGQAASKRLASDSILAMVSKYKNLDEVEPTILKEAGAAVARSVLGGVPGEHTIKDLTPSSLGIDRATFEQYFGDAPKPAKAGAFMNLLTGIAKRERRLAESVIEGAILDKAQGFLQVARKRRADGRDQEQAYRNSVAEKLDIAPSDVIIDFKKGLVTTKAKQQLQNDIETQKGFLRFANADLKSKDPIRKQKAMDYFNAAKIDPKDTLHEQELDLINAMTRFGIFRSVQDGE